MDDPTFANKVRFPTLVSFTLASIGAYGQALLTVMDKFSWKSISVLIDKVSLTGFTTKIRVSEECRGAQIALRQQAVKYNFIEVVMDPDTGNVTEALLTARRHSRSKSYY